MADDPRAKEVIDAWNRLDGDRGTWKTHWQDCADLTNTNRADYVFQRSPGMKRQTKIFDATPVWARRQFQNGLHSYLTSPAVQWFALRADSERLNLIPAVRAWLDAATSVLYNLFSSPRFNFAAQSDEVYGDLGCVGTGVMSILPDRTGEGVLFSARTLKECVVAENEQDRVDMLIRRWEYTAKQAAQAWPDGCGAKVAKAMAEGKEDEKFHFLHRVRPRLKRDPQRGDRLHMAFESLWVCEEDQCVIDEGGFEEFPYLAPRFSKVTGETYGRSPAMDSLPDIKMLNEMVKTLLKAAQKVVDPPLMMPDDGFLVPIRTVPGGVNFYRSGMRQWERIEPLKTDGNIPIGRELVNDLRQAIMRGFYVDWFIMPADMQDPMGSGKGVTATFTMQKRDEMMRQASPMLSRMNTEYTDPAIDRVFNMMWRRSKAMRFGPGAPLPPPPAELSGARLRAEYVSPLMIAQKSSQLDSVNRLIQIATALMQFDPTVKDSVNSDGILRLSADDLNAPAAVLNTPDQVAQFRQQRQQAQAQLNGHTALANVAGAAKDGAGALQIMQNVANNQAAQGAEAATGGPSTMARAA